MSKAERLGERERRTEDLNALLGWGWPAFIGADRRAERVLPAIRAAFSDLELVLLGQGDAPVAAGWAVPIRWDGTVPDLPSGYSEALERALEDGARANSLVVCAAQVHPNHRGEGLAAALLHAFRGMSTERGDDHVLVPLRPSSKSRYPLTPIERYAAWRRHDGTPFDPWLRTHLRMGATVLSTAPRSQVMTGTVKEWEGWTGMVFPDSGDYVIPEGLSVLRIDAARDLGLYEEPNIWVQHV